MFPALYHAHHSLHMEDLDFWLHLAEQQGGPLLELGCGTGRILIPLAQHGYLAYGLDRDGAMLAYLSARVPERYRSSIRVWQADLAQFNLGTSFPLILLPCNTLSTLNLQKRNATFTCVYRHLAPGGVFAASIPNPRMLSRMSISSGPELEEVISLPHSEGAVRISSAWHRTRSAFNLTWIYETQAGGGQGQRMERTISHRLAPPYEYLKALAGAGLTVTDTFGDYDHSPYTPESANWIVVAQKR